jgi:hypothetical protein
MAWEGGYTSALNSATARKSADDASARALQWLALEQQQIAQKQAQTQQQEKLAAKQWELNQAMQKPPQGAQPPMPGQSSQPMMQPPAAGAAPQQPMGAPPGAAQTMMAGAPPGGAAPMASAQAAPAPQAAMPQPWRPSPSAGPALGGAPPQPPQGAPGTPMPSGPPGGIEMPKLQSFDQLFEQVQKMPGLDPAMREHVLEAGAVQMDKQNKEKLEAWKLTQEVQTAQKKAADSAAEEVLKKRLGLPPGEKIPPETLNALVAAKGDPTKVASILERIEAKKGAQHISVSVGGVGSSVVPVKDQGKTGEEYLKTLSPAKANEVKAIAEGRQNISAMGYRGAQRQQMLEMVNQYDPDFDQTQFAARSSTRRDFSSGQAAKNITAINTAIGHIGTMDELASALGNKDLKLANSIVNRIATETGNPSVNNYSLAKTAVSDEMMRVFRQVGASDTEAARWEKAFDAANSPAQMKGAMRTAATLLNSRVQALGDQWKNTMGDTVKAPEIVHAKSKEVLEKLNVGGDAGGPKAGTVENGYRFKGGDPAKKENWEKV